MQRLVDFIGDFEMHLMLCMETNSSNLNTMLCDGTDASVFCAKPVSISWKVLVKGPVETAREALATPTDINLVMCVTVMMLASYVHNCRAKMTNPSRTCNALKYLVRSWKCCSGYLKSA